MAVGAGCSLGVGDSVAFISGGGGFAEYLTIKEAMLVKVPAATAEAAALRSGPRNPINTNSQSPNRNPHNPMNSNRKIPNPKTRPSMNPKS